MNAMRARDSVGHLGLTRAVNYIASMPGFTSRATSGGASIGTRSQPVTRTVSSTPRATAPADRAAEVSQQRAALQRMQQTSPGQELYSSPQGSMHAQFSPEEQAAFAARMDDAEQMYAQMFSTDQGPPPVMQAQTAAANAGGNWQTWAIVGAIGAVMWWGMTR
jgi:hypothetical protein